MLIVKALVDNRYAGENYKKGDTFQIEPRQAKRFAKMIRFTAPEWEFVNAVWIDQRLIVQVTAHIASRALGLKENGMLRKLRMEAGETYLIELLSIIGDNYSTRFVIKDQELSIAIIQSMINGTFTNSSPAAQETQEDAADTDTETTGDDVEEETPAETDTAAADESADGEAVQTGDDTDTNDDTQEGTDEPDASADVSEGTDVDTVEVEEVEAPEIETTIEDVVEEEVAETTDTVEDTQVETTVYTAEDLADKSIKDLKAIADEIGATKARSKADQIENILIKQS